MKRHYWSYLIFCLDIVCFIIIKANLWSSDIPVTDDQSINSTERNIDGRAYTDTTVSTSSSDSSSLSRGQIAGLVIGGIILFCCCGACGVAKSGHWETWKVWVEHWTFVFYFLYTILNFYLFSYFLVSFIIYSCIFFQLILTELLLLLLVNLGVYSK